jgi:predicted MPP superfamily phosphohydrolase
VAAYARWIEPVSLQVRHYQCHLPGLDSARPVRLLHLSDLHASRSVPNSLIESAFGLALELKPDLICITGDFVTVGTGWDAEWYKRTLRHLSSRVPVYASTGNHDGGWFGSQMSDSRFMRSVLQDAGLEVLHNRSTMIEVNSQRLELAGLGDLWADEFRPGQAFQRAVIKSSPRIVLSHNPDTKDRLANRDWDLMLSGHTHGGQIVVPLVGSPWAPVKDMRYLHGLAAWGSRQIHVTCGVGSAGGVRLNCPPEVAMLELSGPTAS